MVLRGLVAAPETRPTLILKIEFPALSKRERSWMGPVWAQQWSPIPMNRRSNGPLRVGDMGRYRPRRWNGGDARQR